MGKKRLKTIDEGRIFKEALSQSDEGTTEEEDNGVKEEEKEIVEEDDVLEDPFESEVSKTAIETERSKEEMSFEKRPFGEALSQIDNGTMHVRLDVFFRSSKNRWLVIMKEQTME